jgi:hypothetical protein
MYIVVDFSLAPITKMVCILVAWLHIRAGVSRSVANLILQGIQVILTTTFTLVQVALLSSGVRIKLSEIELPRDVHTAYQLHCTEPKIIRTACCPKCYSLFPQPIPWCCQWKASPRSRRCNTELWKSQNTPKGPKWVPHCLFTTQSFDSWLQLFLSCRIIEDSLIETFQHHRNNPPAAFGAEMTDIQDSPAWGDLHGVLQTPYHLTFGIYVDWFNPFTNKIAGKFMVIEACLKTWLEKIGKKISCGAILLYCLNLPPNLCCKPENTLVLGLTPPPHMPDATTICHLFECVVASVSEYNAVPGKQVSTFHHPEGVPAQVRAAPLIADLEGSHKVAGFMAHGATMFCSFCLCTSDQIEDLNLHTWQLRNSAQVRAQAEEWLNQPTKAGKNAQAQATGVCWTPLHHLPYWDPVTHVVLGFMYKWLEGVLQHHLHALWGIGRDEAESQKVEEIEMDEKLTDADVSNSADELDGLMQEAADHDAEAAALLGAYNTSLMVTICPV